jgi:hypothetical protein
MTQYEMTELTALERAIRSVEPLTAPAGLRAGLRRELVQAAAARGSFGLATLLAPAPRLAFAVLAAVLLITSGWVVAASAPGDVVYPIRDAIVRLLFPSARDELRVPPVPGIFDVPSITSAPTAAPPSLAAPLAPQDVIAPDMIAPVVPDAPRDEPMPTAGPETSADATSPARATPAIPPDPPGPRATPAVPPPHR